MVWILNICGFRYTTHLSLYKIHYNILKFWFGMLIGQFRILSVKFNMFTNVLIHQCNVWECQGLNYLKGPFLSFFLHLLISSPSCQSKPVFPPSVEHKINETFFKISSLVFHRRNISIQDCKDMWERKLNWKSCWQHFWVNYPFIEIDHKLKFYWIC